MPRCKGRSSPFSCTITHGQGGASLLLLLLCVVVVCLFVFLFLFFFCFWFLFCFWFFHERQAGEKTRRTRAEILTSVFTDPSKAWKVYVRPSCAAYLYEELSKLSLSSECVDTKLCKPCTSFTSHLHSSCRMVWHSALRVNKSTSRAGDSRGALPSPANANEC